MNVSMNMLLTAEPLLTHWFYLYLIGFFHMEIDLETIKNCYYYFFFFFLTYSGRVKNSFYMQTDHDSADAPRYLGLTWM